MPVGIIIIIIIMTSSLPFGYSQLPDERHGQIIVEAENLGI
jgi:hypothetical protein